ncbi:MAG TPA: FAD-dependent oxidoreductase, partial [Vicinamibacterales bacterium]
GGMVVMDEDNCMVDVSRYFIEFTHSESCGKCVPCRVGLDKALRILNSFTEGKAATRHVRMLDELCRMIRDCSLCGLGQSAPNPVLTTLRHFRQEFEDHIVAHRCRAGACEELALSPCENSCPLHMNIPRFLQLFKEGRIEDAFEAVIFDNPLPATTGRVCQHTCDNRCRRQTLDDAVNMRDVHRHIADAILLSERYEEMAARVAARKLPQTGRTVAIVGAGPAGLTCAFYLALLGHEVTIFDDKPEPGGMLRYALPQYRLPKEVLSREIGIVEHLGVRFTMNTRIGTDVPLSELGERFDAVFIGTGAWRESAVALPGADLGGVYHAVEFLESAARGDSPRLGRRVAVIGGGNAAIDSARSALRAGSEVTVIYRRERKDMPAIDEEIDAAREEGVRFVFLAAPHRVLGGGDGRVKAIEVAKTRLGEFDTSGRRKPVATGEIQRFECEAIILAVGEVVDSDFATAHGLEAKKGGALVVDRYSLETTRPGFFAGGDAVTGASNVSGAMGFGKRAAATLDERLMGVSRLASVLPQLEFDQSVPDQVTQGTRHDGHHRPVAARVRSGEEVVAGLTAAEALDEASRCLRCDVKITH